MVCGCFGEFFSFVVTLMTLVVLFVPLVVITVVVGLSSGKPMVFGRRHLNGSNVPFGV